MPAPSLILALLLTLLFSLATIIQPRQETWVGRRAKTGNVIEIVMGDARRLFANHFFEKADVYFHSGYYPSMFDRALKRPASEHEQHEEDEHHEGETNAPPAAAKPSDHATEHEKEMDFLGKPKDWIDRFGRNFFASTHSHLDKPTDAGELLPWLRLSAELDPNRVETYTVTSFWLTTQLQRIDEAVTFLREGWRENPESYVILIELGRVYYVYKKDVARARNVWELALKKWETSEGQKEKPELYPLEQILAHLADLEEKDGRLGPCVAYLERLEKISPTPEVIHKQIVERRALLRPTP